MSEHGLARYMTHGQGQGTTRKIRRTCRQICAAMSLCGRPAAENSGIFCPRAMEFIVSMVEMPVCSCTDVLQRGWSAANCRVMTQSRAHQASPVLRVSLIHLQCWRLMATQYKQR